MNAAIWPRDERSQQRLLLVGADGARLEDHRIADLPSILDPRDLVVLNDAATLPASLRVCAPSGAPVELRFVGVDAESFDAIALGEGDWRAPTEERGRAPRLACGLRLSVVDSTTGRVTDFEATPILVETVAANDAPMLLRLRFNRTGAALWSALYRYGRPIQYSHLSSPLSLWHVQNVFASRPWAVELASAAHGLSWETLLRFRARGVSLASLTHAAGISSTGSSALDELLPLPERYEIPESTADAVRDCRHRGGRVVAVGTSVVRALESAGQNGKLEVGKGVATRVLGPDYRPRIADAVLSGMHERGGSHFRLLESFVPDSVLGRAIEHASREGYLQHEFGDACLVFRASHQLADRPIGEQPSVLRQSQTIAVAE